MYAFDSRVVFEVQEDTVPSPPGLSLPDDNGGHDLLPQFGLTLLDGSHDLQTSPHQFPSSSVPPFPLTMSPAAAAGNLFNLAPHPTTEMT
jgi:hypothetical protein